MRGQQLRFSGDATPTVAQWQTDGWLQVQTCRFRTAAIGVHKLHCLPVDAGIERSDVVLVEVHVQLWLSGIRVTVSAVKDLELFGRHSGVKVLYRIAYAELLRGIAIGT